MILRSQAAAGRRPVDCSPKSKGIKPMRYTAASKWSKERFTIDDEAGTPKLEVRRIYGVDGNSLLLQNLEGKELAAIRPRTSPTRFEIAIGANQPITVRHRGWFGRRYSIDTPVGEMTATVGDFSWEGYELTSSGAARATVSRQFIRQQNITIDVADDADAVSLIAVVLAIETLRDDRREAQNSIPYVRLLLRLVN